MEPGGRSWGNRAQSWRRTEMGSQILTQKGDDNGPELNDRLPKEDRGKVRRGLGLEPQETPGIWKRRGEARKQWQQQWQDVGSGAWPPLPHSQGPGMAWVQLFEVHQSNEQLCHQQPEGAAGGVPSQAIWVTCTGSWRVSNKANGMAWVVGERKWSHSVMPDLCDPVDCSPPGSPVHGILQARILEWVAIGWWGKAASKKKKGKKEKPVKTEWLWGRSMEILNSGEQNGSRSRQPAPRISEKKWSTFYWEQYWWPQERSEDRSQLAGKPRWARQRVENYLLAGRFIIWEESVVCQTFSGWKVQLGGGGV